jgi:hypothetical protein
MISASLFTCQILLGVCAPYATASTPQYQKAVVLRVDESTPTLPNRRRLADSPSPPTVYDFEVSLRVNCVVYVGLYQSVIDFLPSAIATDQSVDVRIEKHLMHIKVAGGREIKFERTWRYRESSGSCSAGR